MRAVPTLEFEPGPPSWEFLLRAQIIGRSELAPFLRLKAPRTVSAWQQRNLLPPFDYESVNGHGAWRRLTIIKWAAQTNRLPPWLEEAGRPYVPQRRSRRPRTVELVANAS